MKYFVDKPKPMKPGVNNLMQVECPDCGKQMVMIGTEGYLRKKWLKAGMKHIIEGLGMKPGSKNFVFVCEDEECGSIFIRDHLRLNMPVIEPGFYDENPLGKE